jgi:short subunit dehydrogenase-like uncharacterized protein
MAVARGHRPFLSGRDPERLARLAAELGLDYSACALDDQETLSQLVGSCKLVLNAAGPFSETAAQVQRACIHQSTHYIDVTGEIPVFERAMSHSQSARNAGIAIVCGAGFDVVPTDCMAAFVSARISDPVWLQITFNGLAHLSRGTLRTALRHFHKPTLVRRNGTIVPLNDRRYRRDTVIADSRYRCIPVSWGDLATAFHTTKIPNITTCIAVPWRNGFQTALALHALSLAVHLKPLRNWLLGYVEKRVTGPSAEIRSTARTRVWVEAENEAGDKSAAWLETMEAYRFTAESAIRCVEKILASNLSGAFTPAMAFGADFILEIPETRRYNLMT